MINFVKDMVRSFDVGPNKIRVGLETFSSRPYQEFQLNSHTDKAALLTALDKVTYKSGGTNTGDALNTMYTKMFTLPTVTDLTYQTLPSYWRMETLTTTHKRSKRPTMLTSKASTCSPLVLEMESLNQNWTALPRIPTANTWWPSQTSTSCRKSKAPSKPRLATVWFRNN